MSFTIQSTPSSRPYPERALHPIAPQWRVLTDSSSKKSLICSGVRLFGMSCLLQNTRRVAPISFSCLSRACSSALVSYNLSLSELSTTQMTPSVCSKQFLQYDLMVLCPPTSQILSLQFSYCMDLMLNPRVGEIQLMSSPLNFLMMVVFPALSSPKTSKRIYFYFSLDFLTIDMNPISFNYIFETRNLNLNILYQRQIKFFNFSCSRKNCSYTSKIQSSIPAIYDRDNLNLKIMSETPLAENKIINNDSGITQMNAYSPNLLPSTSGKQENNQADSIEKILSSSIQRAKQKITMLEGKQKEERPQNKERASSKEGNTNAIAAAMKVLQSRVYELEQNIDNHVRERSIMLKELDNLANQKRLILNNLQESNRKITVLQHNQKNSKAEIKELSKQLEESQNQKNELESKCQTLQMSVRHLETDKQQISNQLAKKEQQISLKSNQGNRSGGTSLQLEDKEKSLAEKEKRVHERERRLMQFEAVLKEKENKFTLEKTRVKEVFHQNQNLKREVNNLKKSLAEGTSREVLQKQNYEVYLSKIREMEGQLQMLRQTTKDLETEKHSHPDHEEIEVLREDLNLFQNKYDELLRMLKRTEEKSKRDEKQIKNHKSRVSQLEDILTELSQKIGKLPNCTKELKYLNVKVGKIMNAGLEKYSTLKTPTKSRSNSLNRSLSRSTSQRKTTQTSQLNNSRHSNRGNQSGSKGKRKESSGAKSKRIVVSQTGWESVEKEVAQLKKEYKRLVKILNETEDEETRNRLNQIAFAIQQKNQRTTKMKQQNRLK